MIETGQINGLELLACVLVIEAATRDVRNAIVPCRVDNAVTVGWLTGQAARVPVAMGLLRMVHALCLERGLRLSASGILLASWMRLLRRLSQRV